MIDSEDQLSNFVKQACDYDEVVPDGVDLFGLIGITGDDASEFMDDFFTNFEIDASTYRWYFHHTEEGGNFGGIVIKSPDQRVEYIAITPEILKEAIRTKRWPICYPEHSLPKVRGDILINRVIFVVSFVGILFFLWIRFAS